MTIWLTRFDTSGDGIRLAVKDCIDVAGTPTTVACPAVADRAVPAERDAAVVASARAQGARVVGKTNLTELCWAADGVNPWTGTPENPLDPRRVPGGSSSGSAVAVVLGEADVAYGTDTGGSVRIPAACCGLTGLKTTVGRIPTDGVYPLSDTLDTVGPLARDVAGVEAGMRLLEPGFTADDSPVTGTLGRLRPEVLPEIDDAVDAALRAAGIVAEDAQLRDWKGVIQAGGDFIMAEGSRVNAALAAYPDRMSERMLRRIELGERIDDGRLDKAYLVKRDFQAELDALFARYPALVLPTMTVPPPLLGEEGGVPMTALTLPFNLAGVPALALPVPAPRLPTGRSSLQLVGPHGGEERLIALARRIEAALS
ncbi:MAG: amidase [Streptosporangiales bacterium]|nr:amidase [Streptosporangiales bacterium]